MKVTVILTLIIRMNSFNKRLSKIFSSQGTTIVIKIYSTRIDHVQQAVDSTGGWNTNGCDIPEIIFIPLSILSGQVAHRLLIEKRILLYQNVELIGADRKHTELAYEVLSVGWFIGFLVTLWHVRRLLQLTIQLTIQLAIQQTGRSNALIEMTEIRFQTR